MSFAALTGGRDADLAMKIRCFRFLLSLNGEELVIISGQSFVHTIAESAIVELLCRGLTCHELEALLCIDFLANILVPKSMLLAITCADHFENIGIW